MLQKYLPEINNRDNGAKIKQVDSLLVLFRPYYCLFAFMISFLYICSRRKILGEGTDLFPLFYAIT